MSEELKHPKSERFKSWIPKLREVQSTLPRKEALIVSDAADAIIELDWSYENASDTAKRNADFCTLLNQRIAALEGALRQAATWFDELEIAHKTHGYRRSGANLEECARRTRAALTGTGGDGWLPIETAPRDGKWFLAHGDGQGFMKCLFVCRFHHDKWENVYDNISSFSFVEPTHWRPLPAPPAQTDEGDRG